MSSVVRLSGDAPAARCRRDEVVPIMLAAGAQGMPSRVSGASLPLSGGGGLFSLR